MTRPQALVNTGRMDEAQATVESMAAAGVAPGPRTYATLLRGCIRVGDVSAARSALAAVDAARLPLDSSMVDSGLRIFAQVLTPICVCVECGLSLCERGNGRGLYSERDMKERGPRIGKGFGG